MATQQTNSGLGNENSDLVNKRESLTLSTPPPMEEDMPEDFPNTISWGSVTLASKDEEIDSVSDHLPAANLIVSDDCNEAPSLDDIEPSNLDFENHGNEGSVNPREMESNKSPFMSLNGEVTTYTEEIDLGVTSVKIEPMSPPAAEEEDYSGFEIGPSESCLTFESIPAISVKNEPLSPENSDREEYELPKERNIERHKRKMKRSTVNLGFGDRILTLSIERIKIRRKCLLKNGRVDLKALKRLSPSIFKTCMRPNSVKLGPRWSYDTSMPLESKKRGRKKKSEQPPPKRKHEAKIKSQPVILDSDSDSDSDLEALRKRMKYDLSSPTNQSAKKGSRKNVESDIREKHKKASKTNSVNVELKSQIERKSSKQKKELYSADKSLGAIEKNRPEEKKKMVANPLFELKKLIEDKEAKSMQEEVTDPEEVKEQLVEKLYNLISSGENMNDKGRKEDIPDEKEELSAKKEELSAKKEESPAKKEEPSAKEEEPFAKKEEPPAKIEEVPTKEEKMLDKMEELPAKEAPVIKEETHNKHNKDKDDPDSKVSGEKSIKSLEESAKRQRKGIPEHNDVKSESSKGVIDAKLFEKSRKLRQFRDVLFMELGHMDCLVKKGAKTDLVQVEEKVKQAIANLERPAKVKPSFVKSNPTGCTGETCFPELAKKHGVKKCTVLLKNTMYSRHRSRTKEAFRHYDNYMRHRDHKRRSILTTGLKLVEDTYSLKRKLESESDSEDDEPRKKKKGHAQEEYEDLSRIGQFKIPKKEAKQKGVAKPEKSSIVGKYSDSKSSRYNLSYNKRPNSQSKQPKKIRENQNFNFLDLVPKAELKVKESFSDPKAKEALKRRNGNKKDSRNQHQTTATPEPDAENDPAVQVILRQKVKDSHGSEFHTFSFTREQGDINKFNCKVCNVFIENKANLFKHIKGFRHHGNMKNYKDLNISQGSLFKKLSQNRPEEVDKTPMPNTNQDKVPTSGSLSTLSGTNNSFLPSPWADPAMLKRIEAPSKLPAFSNYFSQSEDAEKPDTSSPVPDENLDTFSPSPPEPEISGTSFELPMPVPTLPMPVPSAKTATTSAIIPQRAESPDESGMLNPLFASNRDLFSDGTTSLRDTSNSLPMPVPAPVPAPVEQGPKKPTLSANDLQKLPTPMRMKDRVRQHLHQQNNPKSPLPPVMPCEEKVGERDVPGTPDSDTYEPGGQTPLWEPTSNEKQIKPPKGKVFRDFEIDSNKTFLDSESNAIINEKLSATPQIRLKSLSTLQSKAEGEIQKAPEENPASDFTTFLDQIIDTLKKKPKTTTANSPINEEDKEISSASPDLLSTSSNIIPLPPLPPHPPLPPLPSSSSTPSFAVAPPLPPPPPPPPPPEASPLSARDNALVLQIVSEIDQDLTEGEKLAKAREKLANYLNRRNGPDSGNSMSLILNPILQNQQQKQQPLPPYVNRFPSQGPGLRPINPTAPHNRPNYNPLLSRRHPVVNPLLHNQHQQTRVPMNPIFSNNPSPTNMNKSQSQANITDYDISNFMDQWCDKPSQPEPTSRSHDRIEPSFSSALAKLRARKNKKGTQPVPQSNRLPIDSNCLPQPMDIEEDIARMPTEDIPMEFNNRIDRLRHLLHKNQQRDETRPRMDEASTPDQY